jgi:type I restriction enzyme M protein
MLSRGNAEADIRRALVRKGYIKGIIGLPANLFYGTGIPACIVVIDKEDAQARKGIFMIDASGGFMKDGPKNRLRDMDIHKIVDVFNKRLDVPKYARMVPFAEIEQNDFNLNLLRYIDSQTPEDLQDIAGHLQGGIPAADVDALQRYWAVCPQLRHTLFKEGRPGYLALAVEKSAVKSAIYEHPEFAAFIAGMNAHFAAWRQTSGVTLKALQAGCHPKAVIATLAEGLLAHYAGKPLIDPYDIYQHLMDYWAETMQDDCYLIAADGWKAETTRILEKDKKGKEKDKGWTCDLIPKALIVARYFGQEQAAIDQLAAELEGVTARLTEMEEEHSGEDGAFADLDKVNRANVAVRLKELQGKRNTSISSSFPRRRESSTSNNLDARFHGHDGAAAMVAEAAALYGGDSAVEMDALLTWLKLNDEEADLKKRLKDAEAALDAQAYARYAKLTEAEIKMLVVDDKWLAALDAAIHGEMDRVSQQITQRVKELAERYETPLPQMVSRVAELEARVNRHLERMGFAWK